MSATTPSMVSIRPCKEKQELQETLAAAESAITELSRCEAQAVRAQDAAMSEIVRAELRAARQWKEAVVGAFNRHVGAHGC